MIDRERDLIRKYDDAHRAYLEALKVEFPKNEERERQAR